MRGWNAVYVEVSPTRPLDEVFADWPVETVGCFDPTSFLATRQFGDGLDTKGLSQNPVAQWHRGFPEANDAQRIPAGTVALFVPPINGIDFGTDASTALFSVRTDGADSRTVAVDLLTRSQAGAPAAPAWGDFDLPADAVFVRDIADVAFAGISRPPRHRATTSRTTKAT